MHKLLSIVSSLTLVLVLGTGCKKEEKAPAGTAGGSAAAPTEAPAGGTATAPAGGGSFESMSVDQLCDKSIAMMEEMGSVVETNKDNCDAMGDALQKWADGNKAFMEFAKTQDKDEAKKKEFEEKCGPKMEPMMGKIGPMMAGAAACAENAKVKAAMESMGG